ncbi:MAG: isoleucine--tRNA ligase [Roseiflexaceae bacterium]
MFQEVSARPDYVALEREVQRHWEAVGAFERLRAQTRGGPRWSFLDGPITANGPMGVHHAWGRTLKDVYNRYHALLGHELRWQQGFDCQGLWVEVQVEKELGFTDKRQIEAYGVANFVQRCKERVFRFADLITQQSQRLGYWMDWADSYYTLSDENNYGIWGFLKRCHERGWLYRGHDVMPWCPRCGTALSEHEIATEGYAERTHLSLTVAFPLLDRPSEALLAWTTTPWTLPANVAAAVHPELTYVRVEGAGGWGLGAGEQNQEPGGEAGGLRLAAGELDAREEANSTLNTQHSTLTSFWLVKEALGRLPAHDRWVVLEERRGAELLGWRYGGPFDGLEAQRGLEHRVLAWEEVSAEEGTGVVHIAPGAGREDFALGQANRLATLAPLDEHGVYGSGYGWLSGLRAADVPEQVASELERRGLLFARAPYSHRYPVCWRCGTDLVFRLVDEWLIRMDELRGPMMDAARESAWVPGFGLERELDWLRNMGDWMISKKRYWGLALPIYPCNACGHVTVVGSHEELRQRAVVGWDEFEGHSPHRPWVDAVRVACEHCGAPVARVPDVGNPWLDAGIVAFSTLGYHQDRDEWARWFPADLVLESFPGQFRNWFYALLAMSVALEGRSPFRRLLGYATVKDERGEEMHKSKGNAIPFEQAADWLGVEPLRWLFTGAALERNLHFGRGLVEEAARRLQPLWEVYRFFVTYANLEAQHLPPGTWRGWRNDAGSAPEAGLDRWLLARLDALVAAARLRLDACDGRGYTLEVEAFLDDLSNWYVRRARRRFWGAARGAGSTREDQRAAFATLHTVLATLARLLAPVLPFLSEALYQNLVRTVDPDAPVSIHLTGFPEARGLDTGLLAEVALVRRVAALGRAARKQAGLRVRQPLARMLAVVGDPQERTALLRHRDDLLEELNIKALELLDSSDGLLRYRLRPNLRRLGPRLGARLPELRAALEGLESVQAARLAAAAAAGGPVELVLGGETLALAPEDLLVEAHPLEGYAAAQDSALQVALDTRLDDRLRREGQARDLVRAVQEARKQAGLAVSARISLRLAPAPGLEALLAEWGDYLRGEILAEALHVSTLPQGAPAEQLEVDGLALRFLVEADKADRS